MTFWLTFWPIDLLTFWPFVLLTFWLTLEPFDLLVTLGHIDLFIDLGESYAADKTEKEDDIENTCNAIKEKSENKEENNIGHEIKGDKNNKEVTNTIKLNVKKDKMNKTKKNEISQLLREK